MNTENFAYSYIKVTDKATYLEFRKAWKEAYFAKIKEIRQKKAEKKEAMRAGEYHKIWKITSMHRQLISDIETMVNDKAKQAFLAQMRYMAEQEKAHG